MANGKKTGGRKKGTPNKATTAKAAAIAASGQTPLDFMLGVMCDPARPFPIRLDAAKSAAPYVHPKLAAIEHTGKNGGPMQFQDMTNDQLLERAAELQRRISERRSRVGGGAVGTGPSRNGSVHDHNGTV